jgi:hypothetical protein
VVADPRSGLCANGRRTQLRSTAAADRHFEEPRTSADSKGFAVLNFPTVALRFPKNYSNAVLETLLILALFAGAVFYLSRMVWKAFFSNKQAGCAKGCGTCGAVDFEKIVEKQRVD